MSQRENKTYFDVVPMEKRVYFNIPFSQKDDAKGFGMRWDASLKLWYAIDGSNLDMCLSYFDKPYHKPFRFVREDLKRDT